MLRPPPSFGKRRALTAIRPKGHSRWARFDQGLVDALIGREREARLGDAGLGAQELGIGRQVA